MQAMIEVKGVGANSKPPLLFVHGAWHGAWCWEPLMRYLAERGFTSYAIDLPGHATRQSEGVAGLGIMDYVAAVEAVSAAIAPARPVLIGHSMGGLIVQKVLERHAAPAALLIAPCPAMGGSLGLVFRYAWHQPVAGVTATLGRMTAIRNPAMCRRLFFNHPPQEKIQAHFERLNLESSRAIRQMVLPGFKLKAARITSTPVAVAAAGQDYFFEFNTLQSWANAYRYDFLPFPEAAHNLLCEPEKYGFGKTVAAWIDRKTAQT